MLRIGYINYLNVWPLFEWFENKAKSIDGLRLTVDHPTRLNALLSRGELDLAPSSSFEYLLNAGRYSLLPDLSICSDGPVQSALLACPFPPEEISRRVAGGGLRVGLTSASASSATLLRILWHFHWRWPEPTWSSVEPGHGLKFGVPFLEIGDTALRLACAPPPGWHLVDLGAAWKEFTGLPFVFGVWMVREGLEPQAGSLLDKVVQSLTAARLAFAKTPDAVIQRYQRPEWLSAQALADYWRCIRYDFGPREQAGLVLFGEYARRLGLLPSVPGLRWKTISKRID
jgi:chorismate dehydratase